MNIKRQSSQAPTHAMILANSNGEWAEWPFSSKTQWRRQFGELEQKHSRRKTSIFANMDICCLCLQPLASSGFQSTETRLMTKTEECFSFRKVASKGRYISCYVRLLTSILVILIQYSKVQRAAWSHSQDRSSHS